MLALLLALQAAPDAGRHARCVALAGQNPAAARAEAERFRLAGGGFLARQCAGLAWAREERWADAAAVFDAAAEEAAAAKDVRAALLWAQGGNAWLAAGDAARARAALDRALAANTLTGLELGEARLDRARALVAAGDLPAARTDLDAALTHAAEDPLAWLLSATLARRAGDVPRAQKDIAEALRRAADDAAVQLEAGNIAALAGDEAGAKAAWREAVRLAPTGPAGMSAAAALRQFDTGAPK